MKKFSTMLLIALGAIATVSCNKEIEDVNNGTEETVKGTISFKAVADAPTKATLTDDYDANNVFIGGWEEHDAITVDYGNNDLVSALWDAETECFRNVFLKAQNDIYAYYPDTKDGYYSFSGSNRKQEGNKYDSYFDLMYSDKFNLEEGENDIVVPMHRATAIQYFHLTADESAEWANLKVQSATLTVTGEDACIASSNVLIGKDGTIVPDDTQKSITITFYDGSEPDAKDVQLWFNVRPCKVESMTITVELEDGYTWSKTNDFGGNGYEFKAGKLGYVKGAPVYLKATMEKGTNADNATVNEKSAIKVGTSKAAGDMTITVGEGATSLSFYAAGWKSSTNQILTISPDAKVSTSSVSLTSDDGITGNSPFTLVQNEDTFKFTIGLNNITAETTFTLTSTGRFVVWGATYSTGDTPAPTRYNITINDGIVGGVVTTSAVNAESGAEVSLTATPNSGYEFDSWNVTNASTSSAIIVTDNKFTMPAADVNVSATFNAISSRPENEIFYESFDTNAGTGGNDGQWSGSIASNKISQDNNGWSFFSGSGANQCAKFGTASALGSATTPAIGTACDAILTFKAAAWNGNSENTTLKLSVIDGGIVSPATVTMTKGEWTTFTATLTGLTASSKVTFEGNAASNSRFFLDEVSIEKTGEATATYTVTVDSSISNGSVTASPTTAIEGTTVTLKATPDDGYEFESWNVTGATVADATSATTTFTMPAANVTVSATFKEKEMESLKSMDEIFAAAKEAGNTDVDTRVTFNNWVVSGVKNSNAYLTDNNGKGLIIYANGHGFVAGDILSGTAKCKVKLYNGAAELLNLTSTTSGLTVTKGGEITPATIAIKDLGGVNTGAVITFDELSYNGTAFTDGTNTITPYTTFITLPTLVSGKKYSVTGVYIQFNTTKEIAPRTADDFVEKAATKYAVKVAEGITNGTVKVDFSEASEGQTVTITATPATGYKVKNISVTTNSEKSVTVTKDNAFTMPGEAVTVKAEFEVNTGSDPVTVTWVVKDDDDNPGNGNDWLEGSIDSNISWSATKGGNNNPKYYDTGSGLRVYTGGQFTVSAANDKKITRIILTFSGTSYTFSTGNTNTTQTYNFNPSVESNTWEVSRTCRLQKVEVTYE